MKNRATAFMFAVCLVRSMVFADSQTDAPLVVNDGTPSIVQQEKCAGHQQRHSHNKGKSPSTSAKSESVSKNKRRGVS